MRQAFVLLLALLVGTSSMASQSSISTGAKVGLNYATIARSYDLSLRSSITQYAFGVFIEMKLPLRFSIEPEILYVVKGVIDENPQVIPKGTNGLSITTTSSYLEIPLLLKYYLPFTGPKVSIYAAPSVAFLLNANMKIETDVNNQQNDVKDLMNDTDLGLLLGAGISVPTDYVDATFDVRYDYGLTRLAKEGHVNQYNRSLAVLLGIAF